MSYLGPISTNAYPVINYISNGRAVDNTLGWNTYADAAGTQPVDGTGGSANITWNRDLTSPLRGIADFNFVKDAVNRQGQGVSEDFIIDNADLAKVLTISFDYELISGTYATGDLAVYLIQDPAGTPVVIQPAGYQIQSASVGTKMKHIATFQTASNVTSYRLCVHVASVSASAYTLAFDNFVVGPQVVQYGAPVTDWVSYTPVITNLGTGGTSSSFGRYRRIGDSIEIEFRWTKDGSAGTGSGNVTMSLPAGLTVDSSKLPNSINVPAGQLYVSGGATNFMPSVDPTGIVFFNQTSAAQVTGSQVPASSTWVGSVNNIPILGWSSTVQMSNDTDTRVVAAIITGDPASASSGNPIIVPTVSSDTHNAYNATTGRYTVPVPGFYKIFGALQSASAATTLTIFKNAVSTQLAGSLDSNGEATFSGMVSCLAGDIIDIRPGGTVDATSMSLNIERVSGPSAIAASETVAARYYGLVSATVSTTQPAQWNTKDYDTHGAVTTGTSWKFTAPISGKYRISASFAFTSALFGIEVYKNNATANAFLFTGNSTYALNGSTTLQLNAGDYIDVRSGGSGTALALPLSNISIERIGS